MFSTPMKRYEKKAKLSFMPSTGDRDRMYRSARVFTLGCLLYGLLLQVFIQIWKKRENRKDVSQSVSQSVGAHTVPQRALICQYAITTVRVKTHLCG